MDYWMGFQNWRYRHSWMFFFLIWEIPWKLMMTGGISGFFFWLARLAPSYEFRLIIPPICLIAGWFSQGPILGKPVKYPCGIAFFYIHQFSPTRKFCPTSAHDPQLNHSESVFILIMIVKLWGDPAIAISPTKNIYLIWNSHCRNQKNVLAKKVTCSSVVCRAAVHFHLPNRFLSNMASAGISPIHVYSLMIFSQISQPSMAGWFL